MSSASIFFVELFSRMNPTDLLYDSYFDILF